MPLFEDTYSFAISYSKGDVTTASSSFMLWTMPFLFTFEKQHLLLYPFLSKESRDAYYNAYLKDKIEEKTLAMSYPFTPASMYLALQRCIHVTVSKQDYQMVSLEDLKINEKSIYEAIKQVMQNPSATKKTLLKEVGMIDSGKRTDNMGKKPQIVTTVPKMDEPEIVFSTNAILFKEITKLFLMHPLEDRLNPHESHAGGRCKTFFGLVISAVYTIMIAGQKKSCLSLLGVTRQYNLEDGSNLVRLPFGGSKDKHQSEEKIRIVSLLTLIALDEKVPTVMTFLYNKLVKENETMAEQRKEFDSLSDVRDKIIEDVTSSTLGKANFNLAGTIRERDDKIKELKDAFEDNKQLGDTNKNLELKLQQKSNQLVAAKQEHNRQLVDLRQTHTRQLNKVRETDQNLATISQLTRKNGQLSQEKTSLNSTLAQKNTLFKTLSNSMKQKQQQITELKQQNRNLTFVNNKQSKSSKSPRSPR